MGRCAKQAAEALARLSAKEKNRALIFLAERLEENSGEILAQNQKDIAAASDAGMSQSMIDRLRLSEERIGDIANAVRECAALPDPVGVLLGGGKTPTGLEIRRVAVPMGVIGVIFESRPNVTVDCGALCLKAGSACILRGGKEAINSNMALASVIRSALEQSGLPADAVQLVEDTSRDTSMEMMRLNEYLDLLIPRGGAGLISAVVNNATVPVIETGTGNCHAFVDESADLEMAVRIVHNAKTNRVSVCNALETLLCHKAVADAFLPMVKTALDKHSVDPTEKSIFPAISDIAIGIAIIMSTLMPCSRTRMLPLVAKFDV